MLTRTGMGDMTGLDTVASRFTTYVFGKMYMRSRTINSTLLLLRVYCEVHTRCRSSEKN